MKDNLTELEWTGERYVPQLRGVIALEHLHRYAYACEYVQGKIVLDIASGEGYGSEMLSRTASHVYGVDIDSASVNHAKAKYCTDKLTFKLGSCTEIPLEDESVDVVVSFETIEHVSNHEQMMLEIKRILRPNGVMIMSSPERHEYSEVPGHHNKFHIHELYHEEFVSLLKKHFKHTACFGQRLIYGSALVEMGTPSAISKNYQFDQLPQHIVASNGLPRPIYLIGVCSDHPIQVASGGVCEQDINQSEPVYSYQQIISEKYVQIEGLQQEVGRRDAQIEGLQQEVGRRDAQIEVLQQEVGRRDAQIQGLNEAVGQRDAQIEGLQQEVGRRDGLIEGLQQEVGRRDGLIEGLQQEVGLKDSQIEALTNVAAELRASTSWHLTAPFRFLGHLLKGDWQTASNVTKKTASKLADRIPLMVRLRRLIISLRILLLHRKSGLFDAQWYLKTNSDVAACSKRPFIHFAFHGAWEGRNPNSRFQSSAYLLLNPDVNSYTSGAVLHYLFYGKKEARLTNFLDQYVELQFGKEHRIRVSSLLDLLVNGAELSSQAGSRDSKLTELIKRLGSSLPSTGKNQKITPKGSIIIPVYNQVFHNLACLISLFESAPKACFEVIIADDCSTDETSTIFSKFSDRIRVIRTPGNLGFLKNCNHAAKEAKGEFVVFLNNDMILLPDWLDSLVATISQDSECGMVGSKLLNLDGTLQEAGGIFWNDGSAWNYGRGQNPMAPEFNYKKEVDYCSGASICLRKEVWDAVGGFDEIYAPAYCEESDLAFRLRARGLKTIYQPRSVGIHLEGVSCGTDTAQGIKAYQVENLKKLQHRWSDVLKKEHFPNAEQVFLARDRSAKKRHMLFVDHYLPRPDFDAGSKQMATYLQVFVEMGFQISFLPDNLVYHKEYALPLEELGIEVISCNGGSVTFEEWIKKNGQHLDVAFLVRPYVALKYIQGLKENSNASIVFYGVDIHFIRTKGELSLNPADQALLARLANEEEAETECWEKADLILYPSLEECQYIREHFPTAKVDLLPLYCKSDKEILTALTTADFDKRSGILFVGGFDHAPNKDGILWFCNEILPLIRKISPDVCLTIAGSNPPEEVRRLESDLIKVTGRVSDSKLSEFYNQHRVAVAPLRFGAGVKGKVVESLLKGLPIVTTSIGSQGLCNSVKALSIACSEHDFCEKVIALLQIENKWIEQRKSGVKYFEDNFSIKNIKPKLTKILQNTKVSNL